MPVGTRPAHLAATGLVLAALSLLSVPAGAGSAPSRSQAGSAPPANSQAWVPALPPLPVPLVGPRPEVLSSTRPPYTGKLEIPEVVWPGHEAVAARVDAAIDAWMAHRVRLFAVEVRHDLAHSHNLPPSLPPSTLAITFRVTDLTPQVASFLLEVEPYFRGENAPAELPAGLTFQLPGARRVTLASLFRPGSGYLSLLSRLSLHALQRFSPAKARCYVGPGGPPATASSFEAWALSPVGLVLSFPAGQYTAAYCGPPTITIPFSALRTVLRAFPPLP